MQRTQTTGRMSLKNVTRGVVKKPLRVVVYGPPGVGKTTFASQAPNPIFLPVEDGTDFLDVARFPKPKTFDDVLEAILARLATARSVRMNFLTFVLHPRLKQSLIAARARGPSLARRGHLAAPRDPVDAAGAEGGMRARAHGLASPIVLCVVVVLGSSSRATSSARLEAWARIVTKVA